MSRRNRRDRPPLQVAKPVDGRTWYVRLQPCSGLSERRGQLLMDRVHELLWPLLELGLLHGDVTTDDEDDVFGISNGLVSKPHAWSPVGDEPAASSNTREPDPDIVDLILRQIEGLT